MLLTNGGLSPTSHHHSSYKTQHTARPANHHLSDKNGLLTIISQNCSICPQRPRRHGTLVIWDRTRSPQNSTNPQTHMDHDHKYRKDLWYCTPKLSTHVQLITTSITRHKDLTMEQCTMAWHHPAIPTFYPEQGHPKQSLDCCIQMTTQLTHHGWHHRTQPTKTTHDSATKRQIIPMTGHHPIWDHRLQQIMHPTNHLQMTQPKIHWILWWKH